MAYPHLNRFKETLIGLVPLTHRKAIPVGFKRPETLAEQVARLVRNSEFARVVHNAGLETFDEADDFDIEDEIPLPGTPYEGNFDLANVNAMHMGVVKMPSEEELNKGRSTLEKAKNALQRSKNPPKAPPQEASPEAPTSRKEKPPLSETE